jgi:hypothetical protein
VLILTHQNNKGITMNCPIAQQIKEHCSEPEQTPASEIYAKLINDESVDICGEMWDLSEITDRLNFEELRQAVYEIATGENLKAVDELYILEIKTMMGD